MSKEYKIWNGLIINNSPIITGITNDSGLTNESNQLPTTNAVKGYVDDLTSQKLNISGGILTGALTGTSIYLSDTLYIDNLSELTTNKIVYYDPSTKVLSYDNMGISSQWTTSGTSIFYSGGSVTIGSNLIYNEQLIVRKDIDNTVGANIHLINHNIGLDAINAETEIVFSSSLDSGNLRSRFSKIHNIGSNNGNVDRLSIGLTDNSGFYTDILNIKNNFIGIGAYITDPTIGNILGISGNTIIGGKLFISGLTNNTTSNILYFNNSNNELSYGSFPSSAYSALTYNTVTYGSTIETPGTYTINFTTTDIFNANISGNTTSDIIFDFSNEIVGKTIVMNISNTGDGNITSCIFDSNTCRVFGMYDPFMFNSISVLCVSNINPKFWVAIANI